MLTKIALIAVTALCIYIWLQRKELLQKDKELEESRLFIITRLNEASNGRCKSCEYYADGEYGGKECGKTKRLHYGHKLDIRAVNGFWV